MALNRKERRNQLKQRLAEDPFLTDAQLAEEFEVSVATIRLDRMALNIPELRERARNIAAETYSHVKALSSEELIGDPIDIELGKQGISILAITPRMVFERTGSPGATTSLPKGTPGGGRGQLRAGPHKECGCAVPQASLPRPESCGQGTGGRSGRCPVSHPRGKQGR